VPLLTGKHRRNHAPGDNLENVPVPRSEIRTADHRQADRHRPTDEPVMVRHGGAIHQAWLINLSGGGAMIEASFRPGMWERVNLELGGNQVVDCAVRWLKGGRIGLEFAHETRIDADDGIRAATATSRTRRPRLPPPPGPSLEPRGTWRRPFPTAAPNSVIR
jgi:hypothetical protein